MAQQRELAGNTVLFYYSIFRILNCILFKGRGLDHAIPKSTPRLEIHFLQERGFPFPLSLSHPLIV